MVNQRAALEKLWKDRCTAIQRTEVTDPDTKLTGFEEKIILRDQPCKLSFETLSSADGDPVAATAQAVKLFLSPDVAIPAGCRVTVTHQGNQLDYASSGLPGVFTNHQEICLKPFRGWA